MVDEVGVALFLMVWGMCVTGWAIGLVEWRRFRTGHPAAASRGLVLTKCTAATRGSSAESLRGVGGARAASQNILLFTLNLPYASSMSCSVFWFGRAVVDQDQVDIVARVPLGHVIFVIGWFMSAILMTAMLVAVGAVIIALAAISVQCVFALSYRNNLRRERQGAELFVRTSARRLERAA